MPSSRSSKRKSRGGESSSSLAQPSILSFFGAKLATPSSRAAPPQACKSGSGKKTKKTSSSPSTGTTSQQERTPSSDGNPPVTATKRPNKSKSIEGIPAVKDVKGDTTHQLSASVAVTLDLTETYVDVPATDTAGSSKFSGSPSRQPRPGDRDTPWSAGDDACSGNSSLSLERVAAPALSNDKGSSITQATTSKVAPNGTCPSPVEKPQSQPATQTNDSRVSASKRKRTGGGSNVEPDAAVKCSHGAGGPAVGRRKATVSPKKEGGGIAAREGSLLREPRQRRRKQREDSLCCGDQDMENTRKREGEGGRSDRDYRDGGSGGSSNEDHGEGGDEEEPHSECTAQTAEESSEEEKEHGQARNAGEKGGDLEEISSDVDGDVEIPETMQEISADEDEEGDDEAAIQESNGISEYELQRLERIRKNQAFMASIGLGDSKPPPSIVAATPSAGVAAARKKKRSRPVSREKERAPLAPVRRSTRAKGVEAVNYGEDKQTVILSVPEPEPEPELLELDFDDSTVLKYLCHGRGDGPSVTAGAGSQNSADRHLPTPISHPSGRGAHKVLVGVQLLDPDRPLSASGLPTIYTMHFCGGGGGVSSGGGAPPLLAAGGKGGVVALFSTQIQARTGKQSACDDEEDDERTLMNFKAHKGWVSAVRFLGTGPRGADGAGDALGGCRLLSSANDSVVKLWDTSKQHKGVPRLLCTNADLHPTRKGIFAMDTCGNTLATGSKDATVAIATLTSTGVIFERALGDPGGSELFHEKVIKGVDLRDESTVASCGDDANVHVIDLRNASGSNFGVSHRLDGVHDGPCHTVRWHPGDRNLLLTAWLDSTVKLFDLRRFDKPVHVFRGHCPYALKRPKAIHRPEFVASGGADNAHFSVLTCGEKSESLSMYDVGTGAAVSRGRLGAEASALAVGGGWDNSTGTGIVAAALPGGEVVLLGPVWGNR